MVGETVAVFAANASVAALFVNSGAVKLVSPAELGRALRELFPTAGRAGTPGLLRGVAVAELITAAGLLVAATRIAAAVLLACFGVCFAVLGALGAARGSTMACGCFGRARHKPLGLTNLFIGLALLAVVALNVSVATVATDHTANALALAALGSLLLCLWVNRELAGRLLVRRARKA